MYGPPATARTFTHSQPFPLESGETLPGITIAYHTYGELSADADNAVWVCHALTANSDVADWWPNTVAQGRFLDPRRHFVVCANFLGSCYGTTGPACNNPATGRPWGLDFPRITVRDMVRAHQLLARHLGISRVRLLAGASIGGFQCMEWAASQPDFAERLALICTAPQISPWVAALNETQRMAIEADPSFRSDDPAAGRKGMGAARSIALLSYRGSTGYNASQQDSEPDAACFAHRVHTYQQHQGEKLEQRFNAHSYYRLTQAVDSHNLARGRGSLPEALGRIACPTLLVSCSTDILFPPAESELMARYVPHSQVAMIHSPFGHDGFLVESDQLNELLLDFMK